MRHLRGCRYDLSSNPIAVICGGLAISCLNPVLTDHSAVAAKYASAPLDVGTLDVAKSAPAHHHTAQYASADWASASNAPASDDSAENA
jgi:hypothetical protein